MLKRVYLQYLRKIRLLEREVKELDLIQPLNQRRWFVATRDIQKLYIEFQSMKKNRNNEK